MFYCTACKEKNAWPASLMHSYGPCEVCGEPDDCHDVPSWLLPLPPLPPKKG